MDGLITMCLLAVLLLNVGGLLMVVTAQPAMNAWIVTPEADRKEGGQVEMRCDAYNLQSNHIVEWRAEDPVQTLRWDESTVTTNQRFEFETAHSGTGQTTQVITITDLQRDDTDEYICNVHKPMTSGGTRIVATSSVMLSVLYFPNESFPICSPDGPITVDIGTELNMQCSSEPGNPAVTMGISQTPSTSNIYTWTTSTNDDTVWRSLNLPLDSTHEDVTFQCYIASASFPGMSNSCTIGPITVRHVPEPMTEPPPINTSAIASAVAGVGLILVGLVSIAVIICNRKQRRLKNTPTPTETQVSNVDPYMGLQLADDENTQYMGLAPKDTDEQQTSYQTLEGLNEKANVPTADPYMELQPTDDRNRQYMELTPQETSDKQHVYYESSDVGNRHNMKPEFQGSSAGQQTFQPVADVDKPEAKQISVDQHTYFNQATLKETETGQHTYQAVGDDNENPEHEYAKPDEKHTEYEMVQAP